MKVLKGGISNVYAAAAAALVIAAVLSFLDLSEERRIGRELGSAGGGLDAKIEIYEGSIARSTRISFPALAVFGGVVVGLLGRSRRHAWFAALWAVGPVLVMAGALLSQWPLTAAAAIVAYAALGAGAAVAAARSRGRADRES